MRKNYINKKKGEPIEFHYFKDINTKVKFNAVV